MNQIRIEEDDAAPTQSWHAPNAGTHQESRRDRDRRLAGAADMEQLVDSSTPVGSEHRGRQASDRPQNDHQQDDRQQNDRQQNDRLEGDGPNADRLKGDRMEDRRKEVLQQAVDHPRISGHKATQGDRYLMIDDFLAEDVFTRFRHDADVTSYHDVPSVVDERIDGTARRSLAGALRFNARSMDESVGRGVAEAMGAIKQAIDDHPEIYGAAGADWKVLSFALWQYPAGTRLGWHNDAGGGRTGEFILYLHDRWQPSWGGELIILDEFSPFDVHGLPATERFSAIEKLIARSHSNLTAIVPRPNRLVMVRAGTCHYINRVDTAAGSARRQSLTGFASLPSTSPRDTDRTARLDMLL